MNKGNWAALAALFVATVCGGAVLIGDDTAHAEPPEKPESAAKRLLASKDFAERIEGVEILGGFAAGDRKAEKTLVDVLRKDADWDVQMAAAAALAKIGVRRAREALATHAVEGEIAAVREASAKALGDLDAEDASKLFLELAKHIRDDDAKARAVLAAAPYVTAADIPRLTDYSQDKTDGLARAASYALGLLVANDDARDDATQALDRVFANRGDHRSFLAYSGALLAVAEVNHPEARRLLLRELLDFPDDDDYVVERVARGLARGDGATVAKEIEAVVAADPSRLELRRVARAVGRARIAAARPTMELLLRHPEPRVRSEAARALGMLDDTRGADAVRGALTDSSPYVRVEAVIALAQLTPPAEFAKLGEALAKDKDMRVRLQFVTQLYDLLDPAGVPALPPFVEDDNWFVATAAAAAIGALGVEEDMPLLVPLLKSRDWKMRAAAYEGLGRLRAAKAIPLLIEGLRDRDTVVKGVCLSNLQILTSVKEAMSSKDWKEWYEEHGQGLRLEKKSRQASAKDKELDEARETTNKRYGWSREDGIEVLQEASILVVTGAWDKVQLILEHLSIEHMLMRAQEVKEAGLNPNQVLLVNCEGNLDGETMERVAWFVNVGGYAMTTDWALTKTVMPVFPGYVTQFARSSTGNDVVAVEEAIPGHPLTAGVFGEVPAPIWWLEIQAFPITITYPERVEVLVDSAEMRHRYGSSPVGITFRAGLGKIQHSASHFYLQQEGMQHVTKPRERMVFAADNLGLPLDRIRKMAADGVFDGRLSDEALQDIAPEYSMFRLIVNMVREKRDWVENL